MDSMDYRYLKTWELMRKYEQYDRTCRMNETYANAIDEVIKKLAILRDQSQTTVSHAFMQRARIMEELERRSIKLEEIENENKTKKADD